MGFLSNIFWFLTPEGQMKRRIQKMRIKWDRIREKVDKKDYDSKIQILERLDRVEQDIRTLEEKDMNIWAKRKMAGETEIELDKIKEMIKEAEIRQKTEVEEIEKKLKNYA